MRCTVWQAQPFKGSMVLNYCCSRSETRWIFTEEIGRYKCECLHTIKKGIYRRPCEENNKKVMRKTWSQSARVASESCHKVTKINFLIIYFADSKATPSHSVNNQIPLFQSFFLLLYPFQKQGALRSSKMLNLNFHIDCFVFLFIEKASK